MGKTYGLHRISIFVNLLLLLSIIGYAQKIGNFPLVNCWNNTLIQNGKLLNASDNDFVFLSPNNYEIHSSTDKLISQSIDNHQKYFLVSDGEGLVSALDAGTGKVIWRTLVGGKIFSNIVYDDNYIYLLSENKLQLSSINSINNLTEPIKTKVTALSWQTGVTKWQIASELILTSKSRLHITGNSLILNDAQSNYEVIDKNTGQPIKNDEVIVMTPLLEYKKNFSAKAYKLILKRQDPSNELPYLFIDNFRKMYIGDSTGAISSYDLTNGRMKMNWKFQTGGGVILMKKIAQGVLVISFDNYLYLLNPSNGKPKWRKRLSGRPFGSVLLFNDVGIFTIVNNNEAVLVDLNRGTIINRITLSDDNYFTSGSTYAGGILAFETFTGISAFGQKESCSDK